jgi:hypothetical protein
MTTATKPAPRVRKKYANRTKLPHTKEAHPFMIRMPPDLLEYLRERADKNFRSVNLEVQFMLYGLKREDETQGAPQANARAS